VHRVGFATPPAPTIVAGALTAGYGFTESQGTGDSVHHRQTARGAISAAIAPVFAAALRADERYDLHPDDGTGKNDGWVLASGLTLRGTFKVSPTFSLGPDIAVLFPGAESVSSSFKATTVDGRLLASIADHGTHAGLAAGFRLDRTAKTAEDAARLRPGDRLALGVSDYNAVLAGLGVAQALGSTTIKGELSADLLVGSGAPSLSKSPMRVAVGLDQALGRSLVFAVLFEASLSGRPSTLAGAPLVPVEPRLAGMLGLRYHLDQATAAPVTYEAAPPPPTPKVEVPPPPQQVSFDARVADMDGQPIRDARVTLQIDGKPFTPAGDGRGGYHLDAVPQGKGTVHAEADGFKALDRSIDIGKQSAKLDLKLEAAVLSAQVRGLVRSYQGKPLAAKIRIEPGGLEGQTDETGMFQIDVQPGEYDVEIESAGFATQRRHVKVDKQGVVVINADLVKGKK
jgi:hypothetical protein